MRAMDCERAVNGYMFCAYMANNIGKTYNGFVSTVTSFGIFVELDNTIDGLVRVINMSDDYYTYVDSESALVGRDTGRRYQIGDKVKIRVTNADVKTRQIDFSIIE